MWADQAIKELREGRATQIRPRGRSMTGRVRDGALVTLEPVDNDNLKKDDVVLAKVNGVVYLHLIKGIRQGGQFLIGNNKGGINGWTKTIYGIATQIRNR
jgi:hypothetical protein